MTTTMTTPMSDERWRGQAMPPLAPVDRLALAVGLQLLLWSRRHVERAGRAEQARLSGAADRASAAVQCTFAARTTAGPRW